MRRAPIFLALLLLAGCGESDPAGPDYSLKTPPLRQGAEALEAPYPDPERQVSRSEAERLRPVVRGWLRALTAGQNARAAGFFDPPVIWSQTETVELSSPEQVLAYNKRLPCGARLEDVQSDGRYLVATVRLRQRPGARCRDVGELLRVAFVVRGGKFTELRQVPDVRGASPGPDTYVPAPRIE